MEPNSLVFVTGASGYEGAKDELWDNPKFEYFQGDISDLNSLRRGIDGCDYVIHLAGYAKNYSKDPSVFYRINVDGMKNVFTVAKEKNVKKIVWTSSIVTFGPTRKGEIADESYPRITDRSLTEYEESKSLAEKEAQAWLDADRRLRSWAVPILGKSWCKCWKLCSC